jgi:hypothetical protein
MTNVDLYGVSLEAANDFIAYFEDVAGVRLTLDGVAAFMAADPSREPSLVWWLVYEGEPEIRNRIVSAVAESVCGVEWPMYGDSRDLDPYLAVLRAAAITKGYRVTSWRTYGE